LLSFTASAQTLLFSLLLQNICFKSKETVYDGQMRELFIVNSKKMH